MQQTREAFNSADIGECLYCHLNLRLLCPLAAQLHRETCNAESAAECEYFKILCLSNFYAACSANLDTTCAANIVILDSPTTNNGRQSFEESRSSSLTNTSLLDSPIFQTRLLNSDRRRSLRKRARASNESEYEIEIHIRNSIEQDTDNQGDIKVFFTNEIR